MSLLLGDVHVSELERLDEPCATVGYELQPLGYLITILGTGTSMAIHFLKY